MGRSRQAASVVVAMLCAVLLAGCVQSSPDPAKSVKASSSSTPAPTPSVAPTFVPGGTAQDDKAFFDLVNSRLIASNGSANGRQLIDNLVQAGFDKSAMQVTPDKTTINRNTDSILFSVLVGTDCLLGQLSGGRYSSSVQRSFTAGTTTSCLVGTTRPIDW